ncbi:RDD family protein [Streptomyces sp. NPDC058001]|uniref:RDD family protein n=1 Tax=Streptomyces sp. NPDC058001 TaxID=3346300 RepID=UPI0036E01525
MSAPTPAPGDDRPREGYYPDPSIPGYVRYWNGAAWVPGTSRPAPSDGEPLRSPRDAAPDAPAPAQVPPTVEETGPVFFDEEPGARGPDRPGVPAQNSPHGTRPEPATAWGADAAHQSGFGGDQDRRVSWGSPPGTDPRDPRATAPEDTPADRNPTAGPSGPTFSGPGTPGQGDGTVTFRRPTGPVRPEAEARSDAGTGGPEPQDGTMSIRAIPPRTAPRRTTTPRPTPPQHPSPPAPPVPSAHSVPSSPSVPSLPQQAGPVSASPLTSGPGGGQPSWAQQVHRLAGADHADESAQPVVPWKPPANDPFLAAAQAQAAARPAGLGKRFVARLIDSLVLGVVTGAAAVPLATRAADHVNAKIEAAKLSGRTVTVWLLDGTTAGYLGAVLAVFLLFGVLYEVLPTAKWGRTLGKKLCGVTVWDIGAHEPPAFGAALRRWLVYSVPGVLVVGVIGVVWGAFDRPWHQCWHDKAAHTFVSG